MNWFIKKVARVLLVVVVISGGMLSGASGAWAKNEGSLAKQIQGTWTLVSIYNEQDGKKTEPFGSDPRGLFVLTPNGRFSMIIMRASLPKIASNNRWPVPPRRIRPLSKGLTPILVPTRWRAKRIKQ